MIVDLQRTTAQTVETRIEAIHWQRMQIAVSDSYDEVSVTGNQTIPVVGKTALFIHTVSKLQNVKSCQRSLDDDDMSFTLAREIAGAVSQSVASSSSCIMQATPSPAVHAIASLSPQQLVRSWVMGQKWISLLFKDMLKAEGYVFEVFGVGCSPRDRFLLCWYCRGARVELIVATARKGISNSRRMDWCEAFKFTRHLEMGKPFTCDDIVKDITPDSELEQFPSTFVLREGWDLPITFRYHPSPIASTLPAAVTFRTVVTAFHIEDSAPLKKLIKYLHRRGTGTGESHGFSGTTDI
jgi:hypothetical protein